jgi:hypothetical protein
MDFLRIGKNKHYKASCHPKKHSPQVMVDNLTEKINFFAGVDFTQRTNIFASAF